MNGTARLVRSTNDRYIAGVCGGLGQYFEINPMAVRAIFLLLLFVAGTPVLLYLALWLIMPNEGVEVPTQEAVRQNFQEMKSEAEKVVDRLGLRQRPQPRPTSPDWRYDPYTGQPVGQHQDQQNGGSN
jgi:phage shock protein PspC (stress-responsive transcriptional regulator)